MYLLREGRAPGEENGRPLTKDPERPVWTLTDGYPFGPLPVETENDPTYE